MKELAGQVEKRNKEVGGHAAGGVVKRLVLRLDEKRPSAQEADAGRAAHRPSKITRLYRNMMLFPCCLRDPALRPASRRLPSLRAGSAAWAGLAAWQEEAAAATGERLR